MYLLGGGVLKNGMVEGEKFWVMLINILFSFLRPSVLAQIRKLDQTEGNFWKRGISIWTLFINTPLAPGWCACC